MRGSYVRLRRLAFARASMAVIQHPEGVELVRVLLGRIEYCVYT